MWFNVELKSKGKKERVSIVSLFEPDIPAESAFEVCAKSALTECSNRDTFGSHSPRSKIWFIGAVQGVRRLDKGLRFVNLSKALKECCCRCAQSQTTSTLSSG
jgi:hypothetical protein